MRTIRYIVPAAILAAVTVSCGDIISLPDTPHIEFRSFDVFDTTDILGNESKGGRLNFYFEDGNGDLGLDEPVEGDTDSVNMFLTLYRKSGNAFSVVPEDDPLDPSDYRIPYMRANGQNKVLKGTISVTFLYLFYETANTDTIKYEFSIKDRAQNFSETAVTGEIYLSENGTYL